MVNGPEWDYVIDFGSSTRTFLQVVNAWSAEVLTVFECREASLRRPRPDWTPYDFIGCVSMRSILFRAEAKMRRATGYDQRIPTIEVADGLFASITQPDELGLLPMIMPWDQDGPPAEEEWWWYRLPADGPILEEFLSMTAEMRAK